jgi:hypothetical protein
VTVRRTGILLALVLVVAACANAQKKYEPLPVPEQSQDAPATPSTVPQKLDEVALPGVAGATTTTSVAMGPGPVTILGRVDGPDGPVGNARVHLDRLVGDAVASMDVPTAADGTWNVANVLGGRYRIRAYQSPSLGMLRAQVIFVESPKPRAVVLHVDRFEGTQVAWAIAPNPPVVGAPANLKVRVVSRQVDTKGFVVATPRPGVGVTLSGSGSWSVSSSNPSFTDTDGAALFQVTCLATGAQPLNAILDTGETEPLDIPPCG